MFVFILPDSRCRLPDRSYLVVGDMRIILVPRNSSQSRAADIILLVDESGSMSEEHAWIPGMTQLLDQALMVAGIGVSQKNYFGVVAFGDDCDSNNSLGRVLLDNFQQTFVSSENITAFIKNLKVGGRQEDGYGAMEIALNEYYFRDVARQFILITDEDRDVLAVNLTRGNIRDMLDSSGVLLNAAVSEEFLGSSLHALGVDSNRNAYLYDPSVRSSFRVEEGSGQAVEDSAYGTTNTDYTGLAWQLGGAAWDLRQLRQGTAHTSSNVGMLAINIMSEVGI